MKVSSILFFISIILISNLFELQCTLSEWTNLCFSKYKEYIVYDEYLYSGDVISKSQFWDKLDKFRSMSSDELEDIDTKNCHIQKIKIPVRSNICILGDIHGSIHSLLRCLWRLVCLGILDDEYKIKKNNFYFIFLGDYVDRVYCGVEVLSTILDIKLANWDKVFLLRGNHEGVDMNFTNGFFDELYFKHIGSIFKIESYFYQYLPHALFLGSGDDDNWAQFCHGGIEPKLKKEIKTVLSSKAELNKLYAAVLPDEFEVDNFFNWMDFFEDAQGFDQDPKSHRPYAGCDFITKSLSEYGLKAVLRGHQHCDFGLKIGGESHWTDFIKHGNEFLLSEAKWPIFTFSTAAEIGVVPYDCFGILTTADKFENWKLNPFEYELPDDRNDKFVSITKADSKSDDLFKINWTTTLSDKIICDELLQIASIKKDIEDKELKTIKKKIKKLKIKKAEKINIR